MFPYDSALLEVVQETPQTVSDVLRMLDRIQGICVDLDGLKWFNGLYRGVTAAVKARVEAGGFADPKWISDLDVVFARFYFAAVKASLAGKGAPGCWQAVMDSRDRIMAARIQFALAGMNSHINHDLPQAIVAACLATGATPVHGSKHYEDYTAVNATLASLIESAKKALDLRLAGDALPPLSHLEETIAAWNVGAARESAWLVSEHLWRVQSMAQIAGSVVETIDGLTTVINKALLVPVPLVGGGVILRS